VKTEYKNENEMREDRERGRVGEEGDTQGGRENWREKFFTARGTRPPSRTSVVPYSTLPAFYRFRPPSASPHSEGRVACLAHAGADVLYDRGVARTENNYAGVKRRRHPPTKGPAEGKIFI